MGALFEGTIKRRIACENRKIRGHRTRNTKRN